MARWQRVLDETFTQQPSARAWEELWRAIGRIRNGPSLDRALEHALEGLQTWPDTMRLAPVPWRTSMLSNQPNPRLVLARALRFDWDTPVDADNVRTCLASMAPFHFTHLDFGGHAIGVRGVKALAGSPALAHVRVLNLVRAFREGRTAIEALATSPHAANLIHLDISDTFTTDQGFADLVAAPWFPNLQTLRCRGHHTCWNPHGKGITTASVERLVAHPSLALTELDLTANRIDDDGIGMIAECSALAGLERLWLSDNATTAAGRERLLQSTVFTHLEQPDAGLFDENAPSPHDEWDATPEPVPVPELLTRLRDLLYREPTEQRWWELVELFDGHSAQTPEWTVALDYAAEHLASWPDQLRVAGANIASSMFNPQRDERLRLARTVDVPMWKAISAEQLACFQRHWDELGLQGLRLSGWQITPLREFFKTASIRGVKRLDLSGGFREGITLLRALAKADWLQGLEELNLSYANLSARGLATLAESPIFTSLTTLRLENNPELGPEAMELLAERFPHLRALHATACGCMDLGAMHLARSRTLTALEELDLSHNEIGRDGASALAAAEHLPGLRRLALGGNFLGAEATQALAASSLLQNLHTLELSETGMGPAGFQALCAAHMPALRVLKVEYDELLDDAIAPITTASFAPALVELELAGNPLGPDGALALAAAPLRGLRRLGLSECEIGDEGCVALAASPHLTGLEDLDVSNGDIDDHAVATLIRRLPNLSTVEFWGCEVGSASIEAARNAPSLEPWVLEILENESTVGRDWENRW